MAVDGQRGSKISYKGNSSVIEGFNIHHLLEFGLAKYDIP